MAENLKTTKYTDGSSIPLVEDALVWKTLNSPGYCWNYNNEATYKSAYGAIYNGFTVSTDKLCPTGWHVPSDAEWTTLVDFAGGKPVGGKLKEYGTQHWSSPNNGGSSAYGFYALPAGSRTITG
jgi:uncharacterized protein (TIGR02145 family)